MTYIRDEKRPTHLLTRFQQTYLDPVTGSLKYNMRVYTNDLPDPIYIMALYALDSMTSRRRIKFNP